MCNEKFIFYDHLLILYIKKNLVLFRDIWNFIELLTENISNIIEFVENNVEEVKHLLKKSPTNT